MSIAYAINRLLRRGGYQVVRTETLALLKAQCPPLPGSTSCSAKTDSPLPRVSTSADASGRLSKFLYDEKASDRDAVTLLDVGCSGGVGVEWNVFGTALHAVGFDPLTTEVERLRKAESRLNISYEATFVGLNPAQEHEREVHEASLSRRDQFFPNFFARSSARRAMASLSYNYEKEIFNSGSPVVYAPHRTSLDDFTQRHSITNVDVLKIDTDGSDLQVLIGAQRILESSVLAVRLECFFHGPRSAYANTFSNVDKFMTKRGFYLFDIKPFTYTRGVLPGPFQYDLLAQTIGGSPVWADVLYVRDLASPNYRALFDFEADGERVIKTACILEAYGLGDAAVEVLLSYADQLSYPVERLLDLLVPDKANAGVSYREYIDRFVADPTVWFPSNRA